MSTLSHKRHDFRKINLLSTKCALWFSLQVFSETFLVLRRTERDMIKNVYWSSCKVKVKVKVTLVQGLRLCTGRRPVQSFSACTRVTFTFTFYFSELTCFISKHSRMSSTKIITVKLVTRVTFTFTFYFSELTCFISKHSRMSSTKIITVKLVTSANPKKTWKARSWNTVQTPTSVTPQAEYNSKLHQNKNTKHFSRPPNSLNIKNVNFSRYRPGCDP